MKIESQDRTIESIMVSGFFRIPRFQRPYSWTRENIEEFWQDVVERTDKEYFIGSLVVFREANGVSGVVDGQQRLTTITMLLCCIRDLAKIEGDNDLVESTHSLVQRKNLSNKKQYTLQTETSYPFFQKKIQSLEKDDEIIEPGVEEMLISEGFSYFEEKVKEALEKASNTAKTATQKIRARIAKLKEIRKAVLGLNAIFIELENEDDAYEIFETLNTRGKDLSLSDLVKNHVTRLIPEESAGVDRGKERWIKMVESLENSDVEISVDTFLHHYWLSRKEYITSKKLFKSIKRDVRRSNAQEFLKSLEEDALTYRTILEPESQKWRLEQRNIRDSLKALNIFRIRQPLPFVLSIMRAYNKKGLTVSQTERALKLIENFHFAFSTITSQRSSGGASLRYARYGMRIFGAADKNERNRIINELEGILKERQVKFDEFQSNFLDLRFSEEITKDKRLIQYILHNFDRYARPLKDPIVYEEMTIEHLAEQSSTELRTKDLARIGNLFLVSDELNGKLGTKPFKKKREILESEKVSFVGDTLKTASHWRREEVLKRSKEMADLAFNEIWKV